MTKELSTERAIEALYTVRAYYASLTAGYPKGKDCKGIDDVMCSEIANSCLMAIKALEQTRWIPISERLPDKSGKYWCTFGGTNLTGIDYYTTKSEAKEIYDEPEEYVGWQSQNVIAWMPLPQPYTESEDKKCGMSICDSCNNTRCIFQYGIKRTHCDLYKAESEEEEC